jgi:KDO2-lipid IV(A) lauroyltransferase
MNLKPLINKLGLGLIRYGKKKFQVKDAVLAEKRGMRLTNLLWYLDKKHRLQTLANLAIAFPELSKAEQYKMARSNYRHIGCLVADFMRSPTLSDEEVAMPEDGSEHLDQVINAGKGVLLITAHLGNWERLGAWSDSRSVRLSGVARDANDDQLTVEITKIRENRSLNILSSGSAAREILTNLKAGEMIVILPDQNNDEVYIPFFGRIAGTVLGPARIHLKTGAPIVPMCFLRSGPGQYRVVFREPLIAREGEDATALMTRINEEIEAMIRLAPEQYLWMHDRWRNARRKGLF